MCVCVWMPRDTYPIVAPTRIATTMVHTRTAKNIANGGIIPYRYVYK